MKDSMVPTVTEGAVGKVTVDCDGLPPYMENTKNMKTSSKFRTKHLVIFGVTAIILVAMVIGAALFGVYMQNQHVENLVTEMTINTKNGKEHIRADPETGEEEYELPDRKFSVLYDFKRGITVFRTSMNGSPACFLQPLNKTGLMSPTGLANYIKNKGSLMNRDPEATEFYTFAGVESKVKDTSFLSDRARSICDGLPVYWMKVAGPYTRPSRHGGRTRRAPCRCRCVIIIRIIIIYRCYGP